MDSSFGGRRHDAGLLFVSYQRDPRIGYIKILHRMSKLDMLINAPRISAAASLLAREAWPRTNLIYRRCRRGMAAICVRRAKAALSTGCEPHPAPAPSGSKTGCASSRARSLCTPKNAVSTGPWRLMITALALSAMAIRHDGLTHKQNTEPLQTC